MAVHRFEIAILVQELVAPSDAEGGDDDIYRLARRQAEASQGAIKPRRFDRRLITQHVFYLEYAQRSFHSRRVRFVARALQAFKQDQIADDNVVWIRERT
jgi:hypothetical protein